MAGYLTLIEQYWVRDSLKNASSSGSLRGGCADGGELMRFRSIQSQLAVDLRFLDQFHAAFAVIGRTCSSSAINFLRAIHRFDSANSVINCAVFLNSPR